MLNLSAVSSLFFSVLWVLQSVLPNHFFFHVCMIAADGSTDELAFSEVVKRVNGKCCREVRGESPSI